METEVLQTVRQYAEGIHGKEGFRYICTVVANCKMLAVELQGQASRVEEDTEVMEASWRENRVATTWQGNSSLPNLDKDALIIAGYLHDISTVSHGYYDHHLKSATLAVEFLRELNVPYERISKVEQAILAHTTAVPAEQRESVPLEGRILYDADKLGRLSGLAVVTSLIEFGAHYPNKAVTGEVLAAILRHIEECFVELYQSLNTAPARTLAREKFGNTLAFLDGVVEHLSDATPV